MTKSVNWKKIIILGIFIIIPILRYSGFYIGDYIMGDADVIQYFSAQKALSQSIISGDFMMWNRYLALGTPETNVAGLYIFNIFFSLLPIKQYSYFFFIFHSFIGATGFFLYLLTKDVEENVAFAFGIIYQCSVMMGGLRKGHPSIIAGYSLIAIVLYFHAKYLKEKKIKYLILAAISLGIMSTATLQPTFYAALILFIYMTVNMIIDGDKIHEITARVFAWGIILLGTMSYSLIPFFEITREYSSYGSTATSFETFTSYSMNPVKLLYMLFPNVFTNEYQAFGYMNSGEIDNEMYLGVVVCILLLFSIRIYYKDIRKFVEAICGIAAFIIGCMAHFPVIAKVLYMIPVINGFRCSSRALYLFYVFCFSIAAETLSDIIRNNEYKSLIDIIKNVVSFLISALAISYLVIGSIIDEENQLLKIHNVNSVVLRPFVILASLWFVLYVWDYLRGTRIFKNISNANTVVIIIILLISVIDIWPYSSRTTLTPFSILDNDKLDLATLNTQDGRFKVWDDFDNVDGAHYSIISQNKSEPWHVASLNSYLAFNNPMLCKYMKNLGLDINSIPFNYSGLMTGTRIAQDIIVNQNDFLSMAGVKYIIDSSELISLENDDDEYEYCMTDNRGYNIFENRNAREILYIPEEVIQLQNEDIYANDIYHVLDKQAYISSDKISSVDQQVDISIVNYKNNSIEASVLSEEETYLCFSNCYSPKWTVFVDGVEEEIDVVNGLIMGVKVSGGSHVVRFVYRDYGYIIGLMISMITLFICFWIMMNEKNNERKIGEKRG